MEKADEAVCPLIIRLLLSNQYFISRKVIRSNFSPIWVLSPCLNVTLFLSLSHHPPLSPPLLSLSLHRPLSSSSLFLSPPLIHILLFSLFLLLCFSLPSSLY